MGPVTQRSVLVDEWLAGLGCAGHAWRHDAAFRRIQRRQRPRPGKTIGRQPVRALEFDPGLRGARTEHAIDRQRAAGRALPVDGVFGTCTAEARIEFQRAHGLPADGLAGPRTLASLYPPEGCVVPPRVACAPEAG